jgi:hypothetical protein
VKENAMRKMSVLFITLLILCGSFGAAWAQDSTALPTIAGKIAYVGKDYNIYVLNGDGTTNRLTDDAGPSKDHLQLYQWPTWATDGRLAYFRSVIGARGAIDSTDVFVSTDGKTGSSIYNGDGEIFNYAYWSPQNCTGPTNCRDLAVLLSDQKGLFVEMVRDGQPASSRVVGAGSPFYYSWSPDGTKMLWQRDNNRVDVYDVETNSVVNSLPVTPGAFLSPGWSPVDDRLLFGALNTDGASTDLVISANAQTTTLAAKLRGPVSFAWSPDGNAIAYDDRQGPLMVIDAVTGKTIARSPSTGVLAYFWSPDSHLIAYLTLTTGAIPPGGFNAFSGPQGVMAALQPNPAGLAWTVLDIANGNTRTYPPFLPTRDMVYMLSYFDQFGKSHRVWSPDSKQLIYSEVQSGTDGDKQVITLLDVTRQDTVPLSVAEGTFGVWSFQ